MPDTTEKRSWGAQEVADRLGLSKRTITRHIKRGKLDALQPGRKYIISRSALVDYLGSEEQVSDIFGEAEMRND